MMALQSWQRLCLVLAALTAANVAVATVHKLQGSFTRSDAASIGGPWIDVYDGVQAWGGVALGIKTLVGNVTALEAGVVRYVTP